MMKTAIDLSHHKAFSPRLVVVALLCAALTTLFWSDELYAQGPRNFRIPLNDLPNVESSEAEAEAEAETLPEHGKVERRVIVDTDAGVDDAAALIWLLSQRNYRVNVVGVVGVTGNTTVTQVVNNLSLILGWLDREDIPIVKGAYNPLVQTQSLTPAFIHGLDGLWYTSPETVGVADSEDATRFYCDKLRPGTLVIALGPLTNIANALEGAGTQCPNKWMNVEIVSLGGAVDDGNQTPVTEYNYWQDPEAVDKVLSLAPMRGAWLKIVLADAFRQFEIAPSDIRQLDRKGNDAIQNLLDPALSTYMYSLTGGKATELPDPAAVIYALDNRLGTSKIGLVDVLSGAGIPEVARGQTIVGTEFNEILTMVLPDATLSELAYRANTEPGFDLFAELEILLADKILANAELITDIDARRMQNIFMQGLRTGLFSTSVNGESSEASDYENHMFVPQVSRK